MPSFQTEPKDHAVTFATHSRPGRPHDRGRPARRTSLTANACSGIVARRFRVEEGHPSVSAGGLFVKER